MQPAKKKPRKRVQRKSANVQAVGVPGSAFLSLASVTDCAGTVLSAQAAAFPLPSSVHYPVIQLQTIMGFCFTPYMHFLSSSILPVIQSFKKTSTKEVHHQGKSLAPRFQWISSPRCPKPDSVPTGKHSHVLCQPSSLS